MYADVVSLPGKLKSNHPKPSLTQMHAVKMYVQRVTVWLAIIAQRQSNTTLSLIQDSNAAT